MSSSFSRSLPPRPDLDQQRKLAKDLLDAFTAGDPETRARVREVLPDKPAIALADAQFVLAREYGFRNWSALKQHIDAPPVPSRPAEELIHDAFKRRDAAAARRIFASNPHLQRMINEPLFAFDSPALVAFSGDVTMLDVLLEFGADPNRRSNWWAGGFHPLHTATGAVADRLIAAGAIPDACAAANLDRPELLARLLAEDPRRVHERGGDGQTPLHFARSREVVDLLLDAGADIDARDVDHRSTPPEWMLDRKRGAGRFDLARYLVERGASADIFLATALGLTGRLQAMLQANPELLDLRTGRDHYGAKPPSSYHVYFWTIGDSRSPLDVAAQFEQEDTLAMMLESASPIQRFHFACRRADEAAARAVLLEEPGLLASMSASGHRAITDAAWNGEARAVALMSELGFDPRTPGHDSGTALHCAAWDGSPETVAALIRRPDVRELVSIRDARYNATPLGWCCHGSRFGNQDHDHAGVARLLLDAGARPDSGTKEASVVVASVLKAWHP